MAAIAQPIFPDVARALAEGIPGDELAVSLHTLNPLSYAQLRSHREEGLLDVLRSVPEIWAQLEPLEGDLQRLIREFVEWRNQQENEEESAEADEGKSS